jgi:hypothetical protein
MATITRIIFIGFGYAVAVAWAAALLGVFGSGTP